MTHTNLNAVSDVSPFDRSTGWTHLESIRLPGENASNGDRAFLRSVVLCLDSSFKEKQGLHLDESARKLARNIVLAIKLIRISRLDARRHC